MIEEGLYKFLLANDALKALLPPDTGVYMGFVPASAQYPCLMFQKVSGVHDTTMDGPSGYVIRRYQFTCLGKEDSSIPGSGFVSAQRLADTLRQQLNGLAETTLPDGTLLFNAILDNELDLYDEEGETHNAITDYFLHFRQVP